MAGTLFIVPTPIGNLEDITLRALRVLESVDVIATEDTRHSGRLLAHYHIKKPLVSYQDHNEAQRLPQLLEQLRLGANIALVSDAGTPGVSDPGFKLIRQVAAEGMTVDVLPGASSVIVGLVGSALPTDKFFFGGFLPRTSSKRQATLTAYIQLPASLVFFESPHRVASALGDAHQVFGDRQAVVARELSKIHQEYDRGMLSDLSLKYAKKPTKGEIVLIIAGVNG